MSIKSSKLPFSHPKNIFTWSPPSKPKITKVKKENMAPVEQNGVRSPKLETSATHAIEEGSPYSFHKPTCYPKGNVHSIWCIPSTVTYRAPKVNEMQLRSFHWRGAPGAALVKREEGDWVSLPLREVNSVCFADPLFSCSSKMEPGMTWGHGRAAHKGREPLEGWWFWFSVPGRPIG